VLTGGQIERRVELLKLLNAKNEQKRYYKIEKNAKIQISRVKSPSLLLLHKKVKNDVILLIIIASYKGNEIY